MGARGGGESAANRALEEAATGGVPATLIEINADKKSIFCVVVP